MRAIASPIPDEPPVTSAERTPRVSQITRRPPGGQRPSVVRGRGEVGRLSGSLFAAGGEAPPVRRLDVVSDVSSLTSLARAGGCAAKYPAARLETLLAGFVPPEVDDLLVGL